MKLLPIVQSSHGKVKFRSLQCIFSLLARSKIYNDTDLKIRYCNPRALKTCVKIFIWLRFVKNKRISCIHFLFDCNIFSNTLSKNHSFFSCALIFLLSLMRSVMMFLPSTCCAQRRPPQRAPVKPQDRMSCPVKKSPSTSVFGRS